MSCELLVCKKVVDAATHTLHIIQKQLIDYKVVFQGKIWTSLYLRSWRGCQTQMR